MAAVLVAMVAVLVTVDPALAQQIFGGATPRTAMQGLLAGLGNPVIGVVHLATLIAAAALASTQSKSEISVTAYVIASLFGTAAHLGEKTVANAQIFVALAAVALGLMIFRKTPVRRDIVVALLAAAGLVHGYVMGAPIAAAGSDAFLAYCLGLALIQFAIGFAVMFGLRALVGRAAVHLLAMRVIGAFAVGAGVAILLQPYATGG